MTPGYVNHYFANGGLIVPTFGIPEDRKALATLRTLHPDREIVGVYAAYLEVGGGSIHCITQQSPVGRRPLHDALRIDGMGVQRWPRASWSFSAGGDSTA